LVGLFQGQQQQKQQLKSLNMAVKTLKGWEVDLTKTYFHQRIKEVYIKLMNIWR